MGNSLTVSRTQISICVQKRESLSVSTAKKSPSVATERQSLSVCRKKISMSERYNLCLCREKTNLCLFPVRETSSVCVQKERISVGFQKEQISVSVHGKNSLFVSKENKRGVCGVVSLAKAKANAYTQGDVQGYACPVSASLSERICGLKQLRTQPAHRHRAPPPCILLRI